MRIESTIDAAEFRRRAETFLARDPLRHTIITTMVDNCVAGTSVVDPLFAAVYADGAVVGVAMDTPGRGVCLGELPDAALAELAGTFFAGDPDMPGVDGGPLSGLAFARSWRALSGKDFRQTGSTRLYRFADPGSPVVSGRARPATDSDVAICVEFAERMRRDSGIGPDPRSVPARVAVGHLWLWEDGARPVAIAGHQIRSFGWTRIAPVYTPPEFRRRGYASALTARVSKMLRDNGSQVCLCTDIGNPTSNKIYQDIGYRPVCDFLQYTFDTRTDPAGS
ncbi:GNAT family N-acetyltransferase [Nocardia spumae]|uniref:GNAT family N-acetyltransferase n=1 Tax=Nocardia spumae TaxID=2887190 RepID=UPI001D143092|nr:GNAT family N-acetyltransferase [Nocardia spumae]